MRNLQSALLLVVFSLGVVSLSLWSRPVQADMLCGGGSPPPDPAPSSSSDAGTDASADGPTGFNKRPCMSGAPWSGPTGLDFGLLAGMVVLGGGAAASSRGKARPQGKSAQGEQPPGS